MDIRRALPDDASDIATLEVEYFSNPWDKKDIFSYICSEGSMCFSAIENGAVVGYIIGKKIPPEGEIYRIAVRADKRQRGIGYRLLSYALKTERGSGVETVFLEVRESNTPARALYRADGFNEIGIRKNYYKDPTENAVVMFYGKLN